MSSCIGCRRTRERWNTRIIFSLNYILYIRNEACLKYLLEAGCDIESEDGNKRTPLHWAVQNAGELMTQTSTTLHID